MAIEGINEFAGGPTSETTEEPKPRETDQEIHDRHQSELDAEREEHNRRRLGGRG